MYWVDVTVYRELLKSRRTVSLSIKCRGLHPAPSCCPLHSVCQGEDIRSVDVYLYTYVYPAHSSICYFQWKTARKSRASLFPALTLPSVCIDSPVTAGEFLPYWYLWDFLRGSRILDVDRDVYIFLLLIMYLWPATFGRAIGASVQQTLKHMLIF